MKKTQWWSRREVYWMMIVCFVLGGLFILAMKAANGANFTIVASRGPAGPYCAFPGVCRLPDGRLIVVYYNGVPGGHVTRTDQRPGGGCIAYTVSSDEGKTWAPPALLLDTPEDDRDPSISVLNDGRVILSYFRLFTVPMAGDGVYIVELDKNLKPGTPRKLQHDAGTSAQLHDFGHGLLMMGSYHIDQPYVLRSPDNGRTWQVFAIDNGGKNLDAETDVIRVNPSAWRTTVLATDQAPFNGLKIHVEGQPKLGAEKATGSLFYAVMRGTGCNGHYSISVDGKNWSKATDIGFPLHCPELLRVGNFVLLAQRVPATALYWSADECKTWKGPVKVDDVGGAYPAMVGLRDGSVLIVYYEENKESKIRCRKFSISNNGITWEK